MKEKRLSSKRWLWLRCGRKDGFGIGFDITRYWFVLDLGLWWIAVEF